MSIDLTTGNLGTKFTYFWSSLNESEKKETSTIDEKLRPWITAVNKRTDTGRVRVLEELACTIIPPDVKQELGDSLRTCTPHAWIGHENLQAIALRCLEETNLLSNIKGISIHSNKPHTYNLASFALRHRNNRLFYCLASAYPEQGTNGRRIAENRGFGMRAFGKSCETWLKSGVESANITSSKDARLCFDFLAFAAKYNVHVSDGYFQMLLQYVKDNPSYTGAVIVNLLQNLQTNVMTRSEFINLKDRQALQHAQYSWLTNGVQIRKQDRAYKAKREELRELQRIQMSNTGRRAYRWLLWMFAGLLQFQNNGQIKCYFQNYSEFLIFASKRWIRAPKKYFDALESHLSQRPSDFHYGIELVIKMIKEELHNLSPEGSVEKLVTVLTNTIKVTSNIPRSTSDEQNFDLYLNLGEHADKLPDQYTQTLSDYVKQLPVAIGQISNYLIEKPPLRRNGEKTGWDTLFEVLRQNIEVLIQNIEVSSFIKGDLSPDCYLNILICAARHRIDIPNQAFEVLDGYVKQTPEAYSDLLQCARELSEDLPEKFDHTRWNTIYSLLRICARSVKISYHIDPVDVIILMTKWCFNAMQDSPYSSNAYFGMKVFALLSRTGKTRLNLDEQIIYSLHKELSQRFSAYERYDSRFPESAKVLCQEAILAFSRINLSQIPRAPIAYLAYIAAMVGNHELAHYWSSLAMTDLRKPSKWGPGVTGIGGSRTRPRRSRTEPDNDEINFFVLYYYLQIAIITGLKLPLKRVGDVHNNTPQTAIAAGSMWLRNAWTKYSQSKDRRTVLLNSEEWGQISPSMRLAQLSRVHYEAGFYNEAYLFAIDAERIAKTHVQKALSLTEIIRATTLNLSVSLNFHPSSRELISITVICGTTSYAFDVFKPEDDTSRVMQTPIPEAIYFLQVAIEVHIARQATKEAKKFAETIRSIPEFACIWSSDRPCDERIRKTFEQLGVSRESSNDPKPVQIPRWTSTQGEQDIAEQKIVEQTAVAEDHIASEVKSKDDAQAEIDPCYFDWDADYGDDDLEDHTAAEVKSKDDTQAEIDPCYFDWGSECDDDLEEHVVSEPVSHIPESDEAGETEAISMPTTESRIAQVDGPPDQQITEKLIARGDDIPQSIGAAISETKAFIADELNEFKQELKRVEKEMANLERDSQKDSARIKELEELIEPLEKASIANECKKFEEEIDGLRKEMANLKQTSQKDSARIKQLKELIEPLEVEIELRGMLSKRIERLLEKDDSNQSLQRFFTCVVGRLQSHFAGILALHSGRVQRCGGKADMALDLSISTLEIITSAVLTAGVGAFGACTAGIGLAAEVLVPLATLCIGETVRNGVQGVIDKSAKKRNLRHVRAAQAASANSVPKKAPFVAYGNSGGNFHMLTIGIALTEMLIEYAFDSDVNTTRDMVDDWFKLYVKDLKRRHNDASWGEWDILRLGRMTDANKQLKNANGEATMTLCNIFCRSPIIITENGQETKQTCRVVATSKSVSIHPNHYKPLHFRSVSAANTYKEAVIAMLKGVVGSDTKSSTIIARFKGLFSSGDDDIIKELKSMRGSTKIVWERHPGSASPSNDLSPRMSRIRAESLPGMGNETSCKTKFDFEYSQFQSVISREVEDVRKEFRYKVELLRSENADQKSLIEELFKRCVQMEKRIKQLESTKR